jgi:hypothetical protein
MVNYEMVSSRQPCFHALIWKILQKKINYSKLWTIGAFPITPGNTGGEWCLLLQPATPHLLGCFVLVPVIGKRCFVLSNIKQSWNFRTFCTQNIAASNIQPIRRYLFGIILSWFVGTRRTLRQESGLKNLEPTSSIFWLFVWPQGLQIGFPNFMVLIFSPLGPIQGHKVEHLLVTWGRLKFLFPTSVLTASVKPLGLISTFASIGMLHLSCTLALTPSVKWA